MSSATTFQPIADLVSLEREVILGQTTESRLVEFKEQYRWQKGAKSGRDDDDIAGQAEELCRDIAAFANADGGTLLVGIAEAKKAGRRVADSIKGVDDIDGFKQWVEQAVRNHLVPFTFARYVDAIATPSGNVLAINIPPCLHLVALWRPQRKRGIEYLYRTDLGKEWLNPDEVEEHIMNGSRAMKIQLARVLDEVQRHSNQLQAVVTPSVRTFMKSGLEPRGVAVVSNNPTFLRRVPGSDREIEVHVNVENRLLCVRVPIGLIEEAWVTSDLRVGLYLKVAITVRGQNQKELSLEPLAQGLS